MVSQVRGSKTSEVFHRCENFSPVFALRGIIVSCSLVLLIGCSSSGGSSSPTTSTASTVSPMTDPEPAVAQILVDEGIERPLEVQFRVANVGEFNVQSISWFLDEQEIATGNDFSFTFSEGGDQVIVFEAVDKNNFEISQVVRLNLNEPPNVEFARSGVFQGTSGLGIWFEAIANDPDGELDPNNIRWSLSNGAELTGAHVEHLFTEPGDYNVQIRVTDSGGAIGETQFIYEVVREVVVTTTTQVTDIQEEIAQEIAEEEAAAEESEDPLEEEPPEEIAEEPPEAEPEVEIAQEEPGSGPGAEESTDSTEVADEESLIPAQDPVVANSNDSSSESEVEEQGSQQNESPVEIPEGLSDQIAGLIVEPVIYGFETFESWMDGVLFTLAGQEGGAFSGASSLEVQLDQEGSLEPALTVLESRLRTLDTQGEVHIRWRQMWNSEVGLDVAAIRPSVDENWELLRQNLTVSQRGFFLELLSEIEKVGNSAFPTLVPDTWYCFNLSFYKSTDGLSNGSLVLKVSGIEILNIKGLAYPAEPVISSSVIPFILFLDGVRTDATKTWMDELSLHVQAMTCNN